MSNPCGSDLLIWGPAPDVQRFKTAVNDDESGDVLSLEKALPLPTTQDGHRQLRDEALNSTDPGRQWRARVMQSADPSPASSALIDWGTYYVADPEIIHEEDLGNGRKTLAYRLRSPGSTPEAAIAQFAKQYPTLTFLLASEEGSNHNYGVDYFTEGQLAVSLELESHPWAIDGTGRDLEVLNADALSHLSEGVIIPTLVALKQPERADEVLGAGNWLQQTIESDAVPGASLWIAVPQPRHYVLGQLSKDAEAFETVAEYEGYCRDETMLAGFVDYLVENPELLAERTPAEQLNLLSYAVADVFDTPVDTSTTSAARQMLAAATPNQVLTYLRTRRADVDTDVQAFTKAFCHATSETNP